MGLEYLLYHSHALITDDPGQHNDILNKCRVNNFARDVTGFLHREEDFFVQYLEGPAEELDALVAKISADPRHEDVQVIIRGELDTRRLPDWQMGFVDGDQLSLVDVVGVSDGKIDIKVAEPDDLVDFVIENADSLSGQVLAA